MCSWADPDQPFPVPQYTSRNSMSVLALFSFGVSVRILLIDVSTLRFYNA